MTIYERCLSTSLYGNRFIFLHLLGCQSGELIEGERYKIYEKQKVCLERIRDRID